MVRNIRSASQAAKVAFAAILLGLAALTCARADNQGQILPTDPARLIAETASGEKSFSIEVADDVSERSTGLMFRETMDDDHGMLFVFEQTRPLSFWMRNTYVALSIAFIDAQGTITNIEDRAPRDERPTWSNGSALYALEMRKGWFAQKGIRAGARVEGLPGKASE